MCIRDRFDQIAERIAAFDYDAAVENIRRYNERHNMGREIHRLIDFYAELGAIEHAELSRRAV